MKTALNGVTPDDGGMFARIAEETLLSTPEGLATLARVDAATTEFYAERETHIRQVTLTVLKARGL